MGDQSLGRLIRKRRDALGLSQARLGELVGRSATTIRNWERGNSTPSERTDAVALAAILGLDESEVLASAGFEEAGAGNRETIEQAYASLAPPPPSAPEAEQAPEEDQAEGQESVEPAVPEEPAAPRQQPAVVEPATARPDRFEEEVPDDSGELVAPDVGLPVAEERSTRPGPPASAISAVGRQIRPGAHPEAAPSTDETPRQPRRVRRAAPPTVLETTPPGEPSYLEDESERQSYRLRAMITAAVMVALLIVLMWSFDRATDALGSMWDEFFGLLEI